MNYSVMNYMYDDDDVCIHILKYRQNAYLGLGADRVHQVLAGHLNGLVSLGELGWIHQALLARGAVGV